MTKQIPIAVAVVVLLTGALLQGKYSQRWSTFPELEEYAQRLKNVPMDIADWRGQDGEPMEARMMNVAGVVGSINRRYTNSTLGESVSLDLVCGRPRDMINHTPERCYPAAGWDRGGKQTPIEIEGVDAGFFTNTYIKSEHTGTQNLRVYWSWTANGKWQAPDDFKWNFGAEPSIYKLYVMVPVTSNNQSAEHNAATEFIKLLIPELQKALFNQAKSPAASAAPGTPADAKAAPKS